MIKETPSDKTSDLTESVEFIFRPNIKLNTSSLELHRQQDSMQIEMKKIQQALACTFNETNYKQSALYIAKNDTPNFLTLQKFQPAQEAQA